VTLSAAATATAESAALPPFRNISKPEATASGWEAATIPYRVITGDRLDAKVISGVGYILDYQTTSIVLPGTTSPTNQTGCFNSAARF
jgi:hypothetical protein